MKTKAYSSEKKSWFQAIDPRTIVETRCEGDGTPTWLKKRMLGALLQTVISLNESSKRRAKSIEDKRLTLEELSETWVKKVSVESFDHSNIQRPIQYLRWWSFKDEKTGRVKLQISLKVNLSSEVTGTTTTKSFVDVIQD